jgi:amidase
MSHPTKISVHDLGILKGMDATEIAANLRNKKLSVKEVVECVRQRAEQANPVINAIVASDYERGESAYNTNGILAGVPTYIKDLSHTKGFPTRSGCEGLPATIDTRNEKAVEHFLSAGFVVLGKSATSEFGFLPSCETRLHGDTLNPHNVEYSTGGSSGGAGALVAAGVVPIAHAMDGGGSIRIPASCCGLVGLKPSRGRMLGSMTAALPVDIVTHGVLTSTVRDTANFFAGAEQYYRAKNLPEIGNVRGPSARRLKIALLTESSVGLEAHEDVVQAVVNAGKKCESLGHSVERIPNPYPDSILFDFLVYYSMLAWLTTRFGKVAMSWKFNVRKVEPFTRDLSGYFYKFLLMTPGALRRLRNDLVEAYQSLVSKYDVVLSPTLSNPTPKLKYFSPELGVISLVTRLNNHVTFTTIQNATGAPAISLPLGICSNGLPIGMQFAAALGEEKKLLELAFELEAAGTFCNPFQL